MYTYKCLEVPVVMSVGSKQSHIEAVKAYQNLINQEASQGWEYVSVDSIDSMYQQGCLQAMLSKIPIVNLFIRQEEYVSFKVIVFKRSM
jgi:hypothetical protein